MDNVILACEEMNWTKEQDNRLNDEYSNYQELKTAFEVLASLIEGNHSPLEIGKRLLILGKIDVEKYKFHLPDADIPPNLGLLKLNYKMTFLREAFLCLIHSEKEGNAAVFWLKNKLNLVCQFFTSNSVLENGKKEKNLLHYFSSWNASPVLVPVVKVNEKKEIVLNVLDEQDTQVTQKWYLTQDILKLFGFQKRIEESFKVWYFSPFNVGMELPQYFNLCLKYLEKVETQNKQEEEESNIQRKKKAEEILNNRAFLPTTLVTPSLKKKKEEKVSLSFSKSPKTQNDKNPPKRKNSKSNENQDINIKTEHSSKISYSKRRSRNEISCNNNSSPLLKLISKKKNESTSNNHSNELANLFLDEENEIPIEDDSELLFDESFDKIIDEVLEERKAKKQKLNFQAELLNSP